MVNKYLNDEYQYTLKNVDFQMIENPEGQGPFDIKIRDELSLCTIGDELNIDFSRNVNFAPKAFFELKVIFGLKIRFKDGMQNEAQQVDWKEEFSTQDNPYMNNIITRASNIISNITSSFGQQPIITPPMFIKE